MRPLSLLLPAMLAMSCLPASAGAQTLPYPQADSGPMSTVQVTSPRTVRVRDDQVRYIAGTYAMSNGWYLKVRTGKRHIDARIDGREPMRLLAVAPYRFSSRDGNVNMEFRRGPWGEDMVMSYMPDPRVARVVVISSSPLAAR